MGNYFETEIKIKYSPREAFEKAVAILDLLGWKYETNGEDLILARTPVSAFGWGEKLAISFEQKQHMKIGSESRYLFQLFDLGKNQSNVEKFIEIFRKATLPLDESEYASENTDLSWTVSCRDGDFPARP